MAYEFKNLSEVDALEKAGDETKILGLDNGKPVQIPASSMGRKVYVIDISEANFTQNDTVDGLVSNSETLGDEIIQAIRDGKNIYAKVPMDNVVDGFGQANDIGFWIVAIDSVNYLGLLTYNCGECIRFFPTTYTSIFEG